MSFGRVFILFVLLLIHVFFVEHTHSKFTSQSNNIFSQSDQKYNHSVETSYVQQSRSIRVRTSCISNLAETYPCYEIDLESFLPISEMGGEEIGYRLSDIWGWTDPLTKKEYAIVGDRYGVTFVDISNPESPIYLGKLNAHDDRLTQFRDIKTYKNHAFIVAKTIEHGLQVFDLTILRLVKNPPVLFSETGHVEFLASNVNRMDTNLTMDAQFFLNGGYAENIVINEDSGYAYIVGTKFCTGLLIYDISTPVSPTYAGCFDEVNDFFDAQCVNYDGPDTNYGSREICFASKPDRLTVIDVTAKQNTFVISQLISSDFNAVYQGWLTYDKHFFLLGDQEEDSVPNGKSLTYIIDVSNLNSMKIESVYKSKVASQVGNQIVDQNFLFHANHHAGLRILDLSGVSKGFLQEVAFFDLYITDDSNGLDGAFGVYPFFESGVIAVTDNKQGLFLLSAPSHSVSPSSIPSFRPSAFPSSEPSAFPSSEPSSRPSNKPSSLPSSNPSNQPSAKPSAFPSSKPSSRPSSIPSSQPSSKPSSYPTFQPSGNPTRSSKPSIQPSINPTSRPSTVPSSKPSSNPSSSPSSSPTLSSMPSNHPTITQIPSGIPTSIPSLHPSRMPSSRPSQGRTSIWCRILNFLETLFGI